MSFPQGMPIMVAIALSPSVRANLLAPPDTSELMSSADGLVLTDSNQEGANLLALQTRQQLSTTTLSLAAQRDQNARRLFR
jgi:hypothetical protein